MADRCKQIAKKTQNFWNLTYRFFQSVIERQLIESEDNSERSDEELEQFYLSVAQMVVIIISLLAV